MALLDLQGMEMPMAEFTGGSGSSAGCGSGLSVLACAVSSLSLTHCH